MFQSKLLEIEHNMRYGEINEKVLGMFISTMAVKNISSFSLAASV